MDYKKNEKGFKAYHGDQPSDLLERMEKALASYGLMVVERDKGDWYVEYEIEVMK